MNALKKVEKLFKSFQKKIQNRDLKIIKIKVLFMFPFNNNQKFKCMSSLPERSLHFKETVIITLSKLISNFQFSHNLNTFS
jgi:hypothetical protein